MKAVATGVSYAEGIGNLIEQASGLLIEYANERRWMVVSYVSLQRV